MDVGGDVVLEDSEGLRDSDPLDVDCLGCGLGWHQVWTCTWISEPESIGA